MHVEANTDIVDSASKNTLMQLRKTLCHPYLVKEELEHESRLDAAGLHKSLVEASSKLVFLCMLLLSSKMLTSS